MCSSPKIPPPAPVVERQAYKTPSGRGSFETDPDRRRRMIAGVMTSNRGIEGQANTTGLNLMGGRTPAGPEIGGATGQGGASSVALPTSTAASATPVIAPQRAASGAAAPAPKKKAKVSTSGVSSLLAARMAR